MNMSDDRKMHVPDWFEPKRGRNPASFNSSEEIEDYHGTAEYAICKDAKAAREEKAARDCEGKKKPFDQMVLEIIVKSMHYNPKSLGYVIPALDLAMNDAPGMIASKFLEKNVK